MEKIQFENCNLKGLWNAFLMRKGDMNFRFKLFGKRIHHSYAGAVLLLYGFVIAIPFLDYFGFLVITHDLVSHLV